MLVRLVDIIPAALSGEGNQDSEPNIAVNPANPAEMVATAFTPDPLHGPNAPVYVSTDSGQTWSLRTIVRGGGPLGTSDISVGFATTGGTLYTGILSAQAPPGRTRLQILRTANFLSTATMPVLVDRLDVDQPWVVAGSMQAVAGNPALDRVYVGNNDFGAPSGHTATVDLSLNAATAPAPAGFAAHRVEQGTTVGQDGPPVRLAVHADGTVYAVHQRWTKASGNTVTMDVVVTRDDGWGAGATPFSDLTDGADVGQRVVSGRTIVWNATMGQERLGADSAIAVDPTDSDVVWVAWGDRPGGASHRWTIHVRRSTDRGRTWSGDLRTVVRGKNPCLAANSDGHLGFSCQQLVGRGHSQRWVSGFEVTADGWATASADTVLHSALAAAPVHTFLPYLGDYGRLVSVGRDFYGVFSGSNHPDRGNFPNGVTYLRNVDWNARTLLDLDGVTVVPDSIDPFFFHWTP